MYSRLAPRVTASVTTLLVVLLAVLAPATRAAPEPYLYGGTMHAGEIYDVEILGADTFATLGEDRVLNVWSSHDGRKLHRIVLDAEVASEQAVDITALDTQTILLLSHNLTQPYSSSFATLHLADGRMQRFATAVPGLLVDYFRDVARDRLLYIARNSSKVKSLGSNGATQTVVELDAKPTVLCKPDSGDSFYAGTHDGRLLEFSGKGILQRDVSLGASVASIDCSGAGDIVVSSRGTASVHRVDRKSFAVAAILTADIEAAPSRNDFLFACKGDGDQIFAAGSFTKDQRVQVYRAPATGGGFAAQTHLGTNAVMGLACHQHGVIAGTADPALFLLTDGLRKAAVVGPETADFREIGNALKVDPVGGQVYFSSRFGGRSPHRFDFSSLVLEPQLQDRAESGNALSCKQATGLLDRAGAQVSGRCQAASMYRDKLLIATDWEILRFQREASGHYRRISAVRAATRMLGVDFAARGSEFVTASSDGKLRWYRLDEPRAPFLTLFVHRNNRSWAAWNAAGEYAASADIEPRLLRYDSSSGRYASLNGTRNRYSRSLFAPHGGAAHEQAAAGDRAETAVGTDPAPPSAIAFEPLPTPPEAMPLPAADGRLHIVAPAQGEYLTSQQVEVKIALSGLDSISREHLAILADGVPVSITRALGSLLTAELIRDEPAKSSNVKGKPASSATASGVEEIATRTMEYRTIIPRGTSTLVAKVDVPGAQLYSEPVNIYWKTAPAPAFAQTAQRIVYLGFGVSDYVLDDLDLRYASKDATDLRDALAGKAASMVERVFADPTRADFDEGFDWLEQEARPGDLAIVFMAGHGVNLENAFYFLPSDVELSEISVSALSRAYFREHLSRLNSRVLVLFDACHSGGVTRNTGQLDSDLAALELRDSGQSVVVFTSSTGRQLSQENDAWQNGAFTEALLQAFAGQGILANKEVVTLRDLDYFVTRKVQELTNYSQTPVMATPPGVPDYAVLKF